MTQEQMFLHLGLHWDLAWRQTRLASLRRYAMIVDVVTRSLLDRGSPLSHFSFDGQVQILEELGAFDPELGSRVHELIASGRIRPGPWFAHTEPCFITGESIIRNLQEGIRVATLWGEVSKVAYCPDAGGFPEQLPQILRICGLHAFTGWRGVIEPARRPQFLWRSPDGSEVIGWELTTGLGEATGTPLITPDGEPLGVLEDRLAELRDRWKSATPFWNCAVGSPLAGLEAFLAGNDQVVQGDVDDFSAILTAAASEVRVGELRSMSGPPLMTGTPSTRPVDKRETRLLERFLLRRAEPLASMLRLSSNHDYRSVLDASWRALWSSQGEDILRGCATDQVMASARASRMEATHLLDEAVDEMLLRMGRLGESGFIDRADGGVLIANPSNEMAKGVVTLSVDLDPSDSGPVELYADSRGALPLQVLQASEADSIRYRDDMYPPPRRRWCRLEVAVDLSAAPIPPFGFRWFGLRRLRAATGTEASPLCTVPFGPPVGPASISNEHFQVTVTPDGEMSVLHQTSGMTLTGVHRLSDVADQGDLYSHEPVSPAHKGPISDQSHFEVRAVRHGDLVSAIVCRWRSITGEALDPELVVDFEVSLRRGVPLIEFDCTVVDARKDHKLTVWFPTETTSHQLLVHQPFSVTRRSVDGHFTRGELEHGVGMGPQLDFVAVEAAARTVVLINDGLPGYEVNRSARGVDLGLTLGRSVGIMSKEQLTVRLARCGPSISTPDAQSPGERSCRYALTFGPWEWKDETLLAAARRWLTPLVHRQELAEYLPAQALRPLVGFLSVRPNWLELSALKPSSDGTGLILRLWNASRDGVEAELQLPSGVTSAALCEYLEQPSVWLDIKDGVAKFSAPGLGIITVWMGLAIGGQCDHSGG